MAKILYHLATDHLDEPIPVDFCDGNGKLWSVPFDEPTVFDNEWMAEKLMETLPFHGIVEVKVTRSKTGMEYDMEDARERTLEKLLHEEKLCINQYIQRQLEDRVQRNYPPLPPVGRALSCVIKHRTDLLAYGLRPVGWEPPYQVDVTQSTVPVTQVGGAGMEERLKQLETMNMQLMGQINMLLQAKAERGTTKKDKEPGPDTAAAPSTGGGIVLG